MRATAEQMKPAMTRENVPALLHQAALTGYKIKGRQGLIAEAHARRAREAQVATTRLMRVVVGRTSATGKGNAGQGGFHAIHRILNAEMFLMLEQSAQMATAHRDRPAQGQMAQ